MAPRPQLEAQTFAHHPAHKVVVVVQMWSGFADGRKALVASRNGQIMKRDIRGALTTAAEYARASAALANALISEEDARALVSEYVAGAGEDWCRCGGLLPI